MEKTEISKKEYLKLKAAVEKEKAAKRPCVECIYKSFSDRGDFCENIETARFFKRDDGVPEMRYELCRHLNSKEDCKFRRTDREITDENARKFLLTGIFLCIGSCVGVFCLLVGLTKLFSWIG